MGLSIVIFAVFCFIEFKGDIPEDMMDAFSDSSKIQSMPKFTDLLLCWTFALIAIAFVATVAAVLKSAFTGGNSTDTKGPAKYAGYVAWGIFVAAIAVGIAKGFAGKDESLIINNEAFNNPTDIILTDASMIGIGVLTLATIIATVFSMLKRN